MTAVHSSVPAAPAQRTGSPARTSSAPVTAEALDLLRAAEAFGARAAGPTSRPCAGSVTCGRPGALTVVTERGTSELCGLHAMNAVFDSDAGPMVVVRPEA